MSDLVERLRDAAALPNGLYAEAATRIEELEQKCRDLGVLCAISFETTEHRIELQACVRRLTEELDKVRAAQQNYQTTRILK